MATQYTPILQLALPVTGELNGTWGDVVNDNITSMVEEAIAGKASISTWTANSHTLTTANGTTDEARCAMLVAATGAGGTALTAAGEIICPARTKLFVLSNGSAYAVTLKTSAGTGVAVAAGETAFLFCDGTDVKSCVTQIVNGHITGNLTVDGNATVNGNTTLGDSSADTVVINAGSTTINDGGAIRFEDNSGGEYVAIKAPATVTATYTLTLPVDDGVNGQALVTDGSGNLSWSTAASGDVYGPASATDNAVARFDGTTGKLIQNSAVTIGDDGATVIAANSTSDGLRITQTGSGNALVVEDSANPDSSPTVITANGTFVSGHTSRVVNTDQVEVHANGGNINQPGISSFDWSLAGGSVQGSFNLFKSKSGTVGTYSVVSSGDGLGRFNFYGDDGTAFIPAARIDAAVDGTPGTNDMPGRLVFSTTADGASSPTERMRITSSGTVGIGNAGTAAENLRIGKNITGATSAFGVNVQAAIQSDVTAGAYLYYTYPTTQAAAFTLSTLRHYTADQGSFGAGSAVTTQIGFQAAASLTSATNNYGFYSSIASGTGRYNFYAAGSADNYFAGNVGIGTTTLNPLGTSTALSLYGAATTSITLRANSATGGYLSTDGVNYVQMFAQASGASLLLGTNNTERMRITSAGGVGIGGTPSSGYTLQIAKPMTGGTLVIGTHSSGTIQSDATSEARYYSSFAVTQAASFTLPIIKHFTANQGTIGAGSTVTSQVGFHVEASLTGATNNYGLQSNIASGTGRWNFYAAGSADNYFAGALLVGTTSGQNANIANGFDGTAKIGYNSIDISNTGTTTAVNFLRNTSTVVGKIDTTTTSTAYLTSSDYRLKENIQPMQNALAVVQQLNPVTYTWKANGSNGQGFIAHELQAVVPDCVSGKKDAMDKNGKPLYQGVDTSFLVAILTKAIQELHSEVQSLKVELTTLKGN